MEKRLRTTALDLAERSLNWPPCIKSCVIRPLRNRPNKPLYDETSACRFLRGKQMTACAGLPYWLFWSHKPEIWLFWEALCSKIFVWLFGYFLALSQSFLFHNFCLQKGCGWSAQLVPFSCRWICSCSALQCTPDCSKATRAPRGAGFGYTHLRGGCGKPHCFACGLNLVRVRGGREMRNSWKFPETCCFVPWSGMLYSFEKKLSKEEGRISALYSYMNFSKLSWCKS